MDAFVAKHQHAIRGVLSCFDRVLFRGFSVLEPCRTFSLVWKEAHPFVQPAWRKCLHLYYYFLDRQLGLIHVKVQTWFPFPIQVYVNGHEWVARRLERHGVRYHKCDNAFVDVSDLARAQKLADGFATVD